MFTGAWAGPVVERVRPHARVGAVVAEVPPGVDSGEPIDGSDRSRPRRGRRSRPARRRRTGCGSRRRRCSRRHDPVVAVVERVVRRGEPSRLTRRILPRSESRFSAVEVEAVAHVHVELPVGPDPQVRDLWECPGSRPTSEDRRSRRCGQTAVVLWKRTTFAIVLRSDGPRRRAGWRRRRRRGSTRSRSTPSPEPGNARWVEVEQPRRSCSRAGTGDHLDRPVELGDVDQRVVGPRRDRDEGDVLGS